MFFGLGLFRIRAYAFSPGGLIPGEELFPG